MLEEIEAVGTTVERRQELARSLTHHSWDHVVPILIPRRNNQAVFDPRAPMFGGPRGETYVERVGDVYWEVMLAVLDIDPRGAYVSHIGDWSEWWESHSRLRLEDIQQEARSAEEAWLKQPERSSENR